MRRHSEAFPVVLAVAAFSLVQVFKWMYEDAAKNGFVDYLKTVGLSEMGVAFISGLAEIIVPVSWRD